MKPSYRIAFYVSGHGFGHTSRTIEVMHALDRQLPGVSMSVRTSAPRRLFERSFSTAQSLLPSAPYIEFSAVQCDTGMVQRDSVSLDEAESIRQAEAFHATLPERAAREAAYLRDAGIHLVFGDIPPLAFAAAAAARLPSIALGNFTWDWIYEGFPEQSPDALIQTLRGAYAHASRALRLPMAAGFAGMQPVTIDLPFIARRSARRPEEVRRGLGLPLSKPLVLMSFGSYGLDGLETEALSRLVDYSIVTTGSPAGLHELPRTDGMILLSEQHLYGSGFKYEDLVRAADVVITKPGYGIISEAIANDTALLYTSRGRFSEYEILVEEMPKYLRVGFIDQADLLAGHWGPSLARLLASPKPVAVTPVNGAEIAAQEIARWL